MNSWIDFKYACRLLAKKPMFTAVSILIMSLGVGLSIYMYSFIYGTVLKKLPFEHGDRMYAVVLEAPFDAEAYYELSRQQTSFDLFGYHQFSGVTISGSNNAMLYPSTKIRPDFFQYSSTYPILGRAFNDLDMEENAKPVAVISHQLWQGYLGGIEDIIGHELWVNGEPTEVVGVMPEGYLFPISQQIWLPLTLDVSQKNKTELLNVYARLKPGVSKDQADAELATLYKRLQIDDPERDQTAVPFLRTWPRLTLYGLESVLVAMATSVLMVLVLACVNVGNLLYARASERSKETAIRVALGAPVNRLIMQMMWESLIICFFGGIAAIWVAQLGLNLTVQYLDSAFTESFPYFWQFKIDPHILLVSFGLVIVTALITGLLPALKIISGDFNQVLRDGTNGSQSRRSGKLSKALVVFEVSVSCALLTSSIMIYIANNQAASADYGVEYENMFTARIPLDTDVYPSAEEQDLFFRSLLDDLNSQPEVEFAVGMNPLPSLGDYYRDIETPGFEKTEHNSYPKAYSAQILPGAFAKLGVDLIQGRYFDENDTANAPKVAVVTESFVEQYMSKESNVIGQQIRYGADHDGEHPWMTIVGVIEHVIQGSPYMPDRTRPSIYTPTVQDQWREMSVVIKGTEDPYELLTNLTASLQKLDRHTPAYRLKTFEESIKENTAGFAFISTIFNLFAFTALILAAAGIYSIMANSVQQRTQELGVRRALGATDQNIVLMLMKQGWLQLCTGIVIGLPIAYFLGGSMVSMIGGGNFAIYSMYLLVPFFIALIVSAATLISAQKAILSEPAEALHYE